MPLPPEDELPNTYIVYIPAVRSTGSAPARAFFLRFGAGVDVEPAPLPRASSPPSTSFLGCLFFVLALGALFAAAAAVAGGADAAPLLLLLLLLLPFPKKLRIEGCWVFNARDRCRKREREREVGVTKGRVARDGST